MSNLESLKSGILAQLTTKAITLRPVCENCGYVNTLTGPFQDEIHFECTFCSTKGHYSLANVVEKTAKESLQEINQRAAGMLGKMLQDAARGSSVMKVTVPQQPKPLISREDAAKTVFDTLQSTYSHAAASGLQGEVRNYNAADSMRLQIGKLRDELAEFLPDTMKLSLEKMESYLYRALCSAPNTETFPHPDLAELKRLIDALEPLQRPSVTFKEKSEP